MRDPEPDQIGVDEVELDAEELQQLSRRQSAAQTPASRPKAAAKPGQSRSPRKAGLTYAAVAGTVLVAAIGAFLMFAREPPDGVQRLTRWTPLPASNPVIEEEEPVVAAEGKPVRIRNEFDRSEVFEFPAGTSRQEAREQVSQILIRRAMERQSGAK